jgi:hypothetical protein
MEKVVPLFKYTTTIFYLKNSIQGRFFFASVGVWTVLNLFGTIWILNGYTAWHSGQADTSTSPSPLSRAQHYCAARAHRSPSSAVTPSDPLLPLLHGTPSSTPPEHPPLSPAATAIRGVGRHPPPFLSLSLAAFPPPGEAHHDSYTPPHCHLSKPGHWSPPKPTRLKPTPSPNPSHGELRLRPSSIQFMTHHISLPPHRCCRLPSPSPTTTEVGTSPFFTAMPPCHCLDRTVSSTTLLVARCHPRAPLMSQRHRWTRHHVVESAHPGVVQWAGLPAGSGRTCEAVG